MSDKKPAPAFIEYQGPVWPVDLSVSGAVRWAPTIAGDLPAARALFQSAWQAFPPTARGWAGLFGKAYRNFDGPYQDELLAWAQAVGGEFGEVAMVNCAYEFAQLAESGSLADISATLVQKIFGCTAGIVRLDDGELVHLRTLDWAIAGMGPATRVFRYRQAAREFVGIGFPGFVGVLSGMVPHGYSVTINWAPPQRAPSFDHAPAFLVRSTLEQCDTYAAAVARLTTAPLSTSVFFTVCGTKPDEACVIERVPDAAYVRKINDGFLAQANHHDPAGKFAANNTKLETLKREDFLVETTFARRAAMERALAPEVGRPWRPPEEMIRILDTEDITNFETSQRLILRPKTGEYFLQNAV